MLHFLCLGQTYSLICTRRNHEYVWFINQIKLDLCYISCYIRHVKEQGKKTAMLFHYFFFLAVSSLEYRQAKIVLNSWEQNNSKWYFSTSFYFMYFIFFSFSCAWFWLFFLLLMIFSSSYLMFELETVPISKKKKNEEVFIFNTIHSLLKLFFLLFVQTTFSLCWFL